MATCNSSIVSPSSSQNSTSSSQNSTSSSQNSTSSSQNFTDCVRYALSQLRMSHLTLKDQQRQAIYAVYSGKDVFVFLPTGFGKSICYQVLPFLFDHKSGLAGGQKKCVIIVSPLVSLMVDQVRNLRKNGAEAVVISSSSRESSMIDKEFLASERSLKSASLVFSSPEALTSLKWREMLENPLVSNRVCAVIIDEAHCVSKWSKDFRPTFGRLAEVRALVPAHTPLMACTATASKSVKKEVIECLEMTGCVEVTASPDRPNIYYQVKDRTDIETDFLSVIINLREKQVGAPRVLVYCRSLDTCADLYAHFHYELGDASYYPPGSPHLSDHRLFGMYHAATPQYNKDVILKSLLDPAGIVRVVFATVALGMGVDLRDVNTIVHYGAPQSLEDYFQESGRGGRSGGDAVSTVYWKPTDCPVRKQPVSLRDHELIAVRRYVDNTTMCRRKLLLDYFDVHLEKEPSRCCDFCSSKTVVNE